MYRPVRFGLAALLMLVMLMPAVAPPSALAQVQDGATMTVLRGQVAVVHSDGSAVQPAPSGTVVKAGDEIRTLTRTGALITFFAGTEIEMGEDTILAVERVSLNGSKVDISLKQVFGTTLNRVQSLTDPTSTYRIDAGGATAVVRGTTFLLIGPVATAAGNVSALICMDDCDGRTTFAGCPVAPYTGFGVTVANDRPTSGCETVGVSRGEDYFNAGFEAVTAFEQTFASAHSDINPGTGNLGREEGQRRADERRQREDRDDSNTQPSTVAQGQPLSACQVPGGSPISGSSPTIFGGFGSVLEGNTGTVTLNVPIFLFPASSGPVSVNYATANLTATAGSDYVATSGTVTFPPGSTIQNVAITVNGDVTVEPDEQVSVALSSPVGATLAFGTALGVIEDDDSPIRISVLPDSVFEGNAGSTTLVHDVILSRTSPVPISVEYLSIPGGTATPGAPPTGDFQTAPTTTLTIPANTLSASFSITVFGDTTVEPDETALVQIQNASGGATIAVPVAVGTILDDDGPPRIAVFDSNVIEGCEGTSAMTFDVNLSQPQANIVTVNFATANGSATAGSDYQAASGTVTFAPGSTSQEISITVIGDATLEPDETFTVNLSGPSSGVTPTTPSATGTILNDD
jgi:hypothetical protein